ncbi:MAG: hypothetical protein IJJ95_04915 [Spirochaetales bacterium]|nr:hypothetical protein [Spirochaetales bacterium]
MIKRRNTLIILIVCALFALLAVSCDMMVDSRRNRPTGTWVLNEGETSTTKLIITLDEVQIVTYHYRDRLKNLAYTNVRIPTSWTLNDDNSVDFTYTIGVAYPCEVRNHLVVHGGNTDMTWTKDYEDQGHKFHKEYKLKRESFEKELVSGCMYEEYSCTHFSYYYFGSEIEEENSHLRLYYDGRFEWEKLGSGTYTVDHDAKKIVLHQTQVDWDTGLEFGDMTLKIIGSDKPSSYYELDYESHVGNWPFYSEYGGSGWFEYFNYLNAY